MVGEQPKPHRALRWTVLGAVLIGMGTLACWPVTTRYGVNYRWSSRTITLFEKTVHFISRDLQTRRLVAELVRGAGASPDDRLIRLFDWTVRHVQPVPPEFPAVDDHVLSIIIRGYGAPDQRTEAFALLASYAGFPATAVTLRAPEGTGRLIVAVVRDKDRRLLFDINHQIVFRTPQGTFADIEELMRNPQLVAEAAGGLAVDGLPYERYVTGLQDLQVTFSRMEGQKPWPRLWQEVLGIFRAKS